jgi:hypothetical protein
MYPDFKDNIDFMRALYDVVVALGKREQFEQAPTFYATVQPGGDQPWPLVIRSWKAPDGSRHILVAHYYYSHGRLKPYPEFVVTYLGALVWQRSILEFTMVQPGDASRNYQLEMWAEALRNTYIAAAACQRAAGKADLL